MPPTPIPTPVVPFSIILPLKTQDDIVPELYPAIPPILEVPVKVPLTVIDLTVPALDPKRPETVN